MSEHHNQYHQLNPHHQHVQPDTMDAEHHSSNTIIASSTTITTANNHTTAPLSIDNTMFLSVRIQPGQARVCGLGSKDYRPIDPTPILELYQITENGKTAVELSPFSSSFFHFANHLILFVSLCTSNKEEDCSVFKPKANSRKGDSISSSHQFTDSLFGNTAVTPLLLRDLDGQLSCFFIFGDLSIRLFGEFGLKFTLIDVSSPQSESLCVIYSDVFKAYDPITFPGMSDTPPLSRCLANQGAKIMVRAPGDLRRQKLNNKNEQEQTQSLPSSVYPTEHHE